MNDFDAWLIENQNMLQQILILLLLIAILMAIALRIMKKLFPKRRRYLFLYKKKNKTKKDPIFTAVIGACITILGARTIIDMVIMALQETAPASPAIITLTLIGITIGMVLLIIGINTIHNAYEQYEKAQ